MQTAVLAARRRDGEVRIGKGMSDRQYTRQLATIIAIDAVGFSQLMGEDDEAAVAAFEHRRDLISARCAAHGGRVFGAAGDSIMAEFGSPVEALRAAFDFQEAVAALNAASSDRMRMGFRAGINTGDVIVRGDLLFGDDVNIAARVQEFAPEGGFAVSETVWHHVKDKTPADFADLGEFRLKNIAFPVRILVASMQPGTANEGAHFPAIARSAANSGPPAIAILPPACEPDLAFMADALAEDIINGLSATRWLPVIARSSSFEFRDERLSARFIGHALNARYLASGSLARVNGSVRLAVALEDAAHGRLLWRGTYERPLEALGELQAEVGREIVAMLAKEVDRFEQARSFQAPHERLDTWQLVSRGRWHMNRRTRRDTQTALAFFEQAHDADPGSSAALNELAWWHFWRAWLRFGESEGLREVDRYARRALLMDSMDARPHAHLGISEIMRGHAESAIEHLSEALRLNPSFAFARSAMGSAHLLLGRGAAAAPFFRDAERLSPFDLYGFHNLGELTASMSIEGEWDEAIRAADRSLNLSPGYFYSRFLKIGALGRLGRHDEAKAERSLFDARHPQFTHGHVRWIPFADRRINERFIESFELSGALATA
ncbi:adenylate/guanylate cyclase domain-containing protein [Mesorhizobium sp. RP14(2022)]|uniref:Adenylate/guanylate cyclase domain-containing protein n=1 Tax=Mesorhizobium liriopis TaxID=2953882 RepID=A0ABT1C403_9HYPH|nr:adenylate/guanylate cyclase domain-containing protein [Mesorhizobium liriopis]MCO6049572.1 adenylate/guanylate cyclase domain-containing protein [Mesorhizobium liriopis]